MSTLSKEKNITMKRFFLDSQPSGAPHELYNKVSAFLTDNGLVQSPGLGTKDAVPVVVTHDPAEGIRSAEEGRTVLFLWDGKGNPPKNPEGMHNVLVLAEADNPLSLSAVFDTVFAAAAS